MATPDDRPADDSAHALAAGGRLVTFQYAYSVGVASFRAATRVHAVPPGGGWFRPAVGPTLFTLAAGPWGLPWGPLFTLETLVVNLSGGRDVTAAVTRSRAGSTEA